MEETVVVIMQKDEETGFLLNEITSCAIAENEKYLVNIYAVKKDDYYIAHIKISVGQEIEDWQFDAIYDYYDESVFDGVSDSFSEVEDCYEPTWEFTMKFALDEYAGDSDICIEAFEEKLNKVLEIHKTELDDVFLAISDKKSEYI